MRPVDKHKRELFAQAYVRGETAGNGAASFRAAGFRCSTANVASTGAYKLLREADVVQRIAELRGDIRAVAEEATRQAIDRLAISKETVLRELARIAFANMRHCAPAFEDGDLSRIDEDSGAAIQEIVATTTTIGTGKNAKVTKRVRVKLADKRGALGDLGRHLGLFVDHRHVTHEFADMNDDQLRRYIQNVAAELTGYGIDVASLVGLRIGPDEGRGEAAAIDADALPAVPEAARIPLVGTDSQ